MLKSKKEVMKDVGRVRNRKVKFVYKGEDTDDDGFATDENWITFRDMWVSIRGLRGREFYQANQAQAQDDKVFNCRYFEGLTTDMYIEYQGKRYNIKSINNLNEKNIEYEIHAREVSSSE